MKFIEAPLYAQQITIILFVLALVLAIIDIFVAIRICRKTWFKIISAFCFIFSFVLIFLTMRGSYLFRVNRPVFEPSLTVIKWPFFIFLSLSIMLFLTTIILLVYAFIKGNRDISSVSIKKSVDLLIKGICFYEKSGLVRLINREMNDLSILLFNEALLNGNIFWENITYGKFKNDSSFIKEGKEPIIRCIDGRVISFKKYVHMLNETEIYEIVASDISEEYRLMEELENKKEKLKAVNNRLILYGENVSQLSREKEVLNAKIRIHDDIGKLLLITKQKLSEELTKENQMELLSFWKIEIESLKNVETSKKKSNLDVILSAAKLVNVEIEIKGEYPKTDSLEEKILVQAMHECLTNVVNHAKGKKMFVALNNESNEFIIRITNDGIKPKKKIIEGGGLSNLRFIIEKENGKMIINSEPQFELIIKLIKGERM